MRTIGERYAPAMAITEQAEADSYFEELVQEQFAACRAQGRDITREQAEALERSNLGYYAGYYGNDTRERAERLFRCKHPVFGSIAENGAPTFGQAVRAGLNFGGNKS